MNLSNYYVLDSLITCEYILKEKEGISSGGVKSMKLICPKR